MIRRLIISAVCVATSSCASAHRELPKIVDRYCRAREKAIEDAVTAAKRGEQSAVPYGAFADADIALNEYRDFSFCLETRRAGSEERVQADVDFEKASVALHEHAGDASTVLSSLEAMAAAYSRLNSWPLR